MVRLHRIELLRHHHDIWQLVYSQPRGNNPFNNNGGS
jgi:hypothetical protein